MLGHAMGQGVDLTLLRQCQASMRAVWLLGHEQLLVFDSLPLLIARLHMPGIRDRWLAQWADKPEAEHHSVSAEFLSPSSTLRRDVEAMQPDGSGMSPSYMPLGSPSQIFRSMTPQAKGHMLP